MRSGTLETILVLGKIENFLSDVGSPEQSDKKGGACIPQEKSQFLHEILGEGGETDQVLKVRRARGREERPEEVRSVYKAVMSGADIPRRGLANTRLSPSTSRAESRADSRAEYTEEMINIHYNTVVRSQLREELSEEMLDKALEEKMLKVYRDMEIKKKEKLEKDKERRRHGDNFLPREKLHIIPPHNRDLENSQVKTSKSKPLLRFQARALYDFVAESRRELSFQKGNVLSVTGEVDDNWLRGEIDGRSGIFPRSYVEFLVNMNTDKTRVRARYNFKAKNPSELTMLRGEILEMERAVDGNWVEVRLGERVGIVPVDYLELPDEETRSIIPSSTPSTPERPNLAGVSTERLFKPRDILKSKMREEFLEREKKMSCLDKYITQTLAEFCPEDNKLLMPRKNQKNDEEKLDPKTSPTVGYLE